MPGLCKVCTRATAVYTCPRCQLPYCSLECYKWHGDRCTESFYREQVQEELRSHRASDEERRKLERVVAELNHLDADSEDEDADGDERADAEAEQRLLELVAKAERGELSLQDLTEEEATRFHSELSRGVLGQSLGAWEPWWQRPALVEMDLDALDGGPVDACSSTAPVPLPPHVCCTGERQAHPLVAIAVLEVLYAYAHTMRAFNGEWSWDPVQAAFHLLHLAPTICSRKCPSSVGECLHACLAAAAALPGGGFGVALDDLCLDDTARLLDRGGDTGVRALAEARRMVEGAAGELAGKGDPPAKALAKLQRGAKKLCFLMSFAGHHGDWPKLELEVRAVASTRQQEAKARDDKDARLAHGGVALPPRAGP